MTDMIKIDTDLMLQYAGRIMGADARLRGLHIRINNLIFQTPLQALKSVNCLSAHSLRLRCSADCLYNIAELFRQAEHNLLLTIQGKRPSCPYPEDAWIDNSFDYSTEDDSGAVSPSIGQLFKESNRGVFAIINSVMKKDYAHVIFDYLFLEISPWHTHTEYKYRDGCYEAASYVDKICTKMDKSFGGAESNIYIGKRIFKSTAKCNFFSAEKKAEGGNGVTTEETNQKFVGIEFGAEMSESALAMDTSIKNGDDMLGLDAETNAEFLSSKAELGSEFSLSEDGVNINVKGGAIVAAAKGEVKGTIHILGFDITGTVGGYVGGAGAEGKAGIDNGKFVMKGGVAAVFGLSAGVEIGLNQEGWNNFEDAISFWKRW